MAVQRWFNSSPEQVFAVLQDGWTYPGWVVGATRMREVDEGWPAPGTKLHHSFGVWPLVIASIVPSANAARQASICSWLRSGGFTLQLLSKERSDSSLSAI